MNLREKNSVLKCFITVCLIAGSIICTSITASENNSYTHDEVGTSLIQKDNVTVLYSSGSATQQNLAETCLNIIYEEYEICSSILKLSVEELNPCTLVFCDSRNDPYVVKAQWFSYVDGVQCWPIIGEDSLSFKNAINGWMLYHLLPHEIADTTLRVRDVDPIFGGWFIEGVGEYARLKSATIFNQLNGSFWLNVIKENFESLINQKERIVDLSNRSSFAGFAAPGSPDSSVFYVGSLVFIYDLVQRFGDVFISDVVKNNCTTFQEIIQAIENSTGFDITVSIRNVSVSWIKQQYVSLLQDFNVNLSDIQWMFKTRGIAVGSNIVGQESSVSEILDFIDDCDISMLIVDFGWITWSWNASDFDAVHRLVNASNQRYIPIWLMYRARTLTGEYENLQHQIHRNGEVDDRYICFSDSDCRNWSISWANKLLNNYPTAEGLILYNPNFLSDCCYCPTCLEKFKNDAGVEENPLNFSIGTLHYDEWMNWRADQLTSFISEWKNNVTSVYPDMQLGLVLQTVDSEYYSGQDVATLGNIVDILCPFVALDAVTNDDLAGKICNDMKSVTNITVIADIKIFGPYNNDDDDIVTAIRRSLESEGDGFFVWDFDSLISGNYDLEYIKTAYDPNYAGEISKETPIFPIIIFVFVIVILAVVVFLKRAQIWMYITRIYQWKKNMKIIAALVIFIVIVSIGSLILIIINDDTRRFIGKWEITETSLSGSLSSISDVTFFSNGSLEIIYEPNKIWGDYKINKGKLWFNIPEIYSYPMDFDYDFSNDSTRLTLTNGGTSVVLAKIG